MIITLFKKLSLLFLLLFTLSINAYSQKAFSIKGSIEDITSNLTLTNAVISVLNSKDSTLVTFNRAAEKGNFIIENLPKGDYILLVSYPKYTDFVEPFKLDSSTAQIDFGKINMLLISNLLKDVVITGRNTIVIKGDTIEYDASRFTIQPNAKVEDLLTQLPGIQVDANGNITAQGRKVEKVLLDGEEFFGDDPTLITRNIRGDMVDKVQVFDKKSDQATFTGIDDGERKTTINIQLKDGSKNGHFGKVEAGLTLNKLYKGQAMINVFNDKQKMAAYGTSGNTGKIGFGGMELNKIAPSGNSSILEDGVIIMFGDMGDELETSWGNYSGQGTPLAHSGGAHYDTRWNNKKESINANYKVGSLEVDGYRNTLEENSLPSGVINTNSNQDYNNFMFRHKFDARYENYLDSTSTLKFTLDGTLRKDRTSDQFESTASNFENHLLNRSIRSNSNEGNTNDFKINALWNKKLSKVGRTLSINMTQSNNQKDLEGYTNSENDFYSGLGEIDSTIIVNQKKLTNINNSVFNTSIAFTEALSKNLTLAFNYNFNINNGRSNLLSYDRATNGQYTNLDSLYSSDFKLNQLINEVGATVNYKTGKSSINLNFAISDVNFKQIDQFNNQSITRRFSNYAPSVRWNFNPSAQKMLFMNYSGRSMQPSLNQLQPVQNNNNPLYIILGNPDLRPSFSHNISTFLSSFKMLSGSSININLQAGLTTNSILNSVHTDAVGKTTSQYINLSSHFPVNYYVSTAYTKKIKSIDAQVSFDLNLNGNTYYSLINDELNKTQSNAISPQILFSKLKQNKYSIRFNVGPRYESNKSTFQRAGSDEGWGWKADANVNLYFPKGFELFSITNYTFTAATQAFDEDFERTLWDIGIKKKFLKNEALVLSVQTNDTLDQNIGFSRRANNNNITQTFYSTIRRYTMFSLVWEFNKMGGK